MNLRVRGPSGQATLSGLDENMSVSAFQTLLEEKLGVAVDQQQILTGFPPKVIQLPVDASTTELSGLPLANGDTLTLRVDESKAVVAAAAADASAAPTAVFEPTAPTASSTGLSAPALLSESVTRDNYNDVVALSDGMSDEDEDLARAIAASMEDSRAAASIAAPARACVGPGQSSLPPSQQGSPTEVVLPDGSALTRRIIDSDNSCLFNAVGYVMEHSRSQAPHLRRVIADTVSQDPFTYNDAFLGKDNQDYCCWITDPQRWGGAIELSILARYYGREIAAFDIQTQRMDLYGQDAGYSERVMLMYDGLHYDAMALAAAKGAPEELDVTIYEVGAPTMERAEEAARKLVKLAHEARQFTDTANFTLRCGVCKIGVRGQKEASEHAKETGHAEFSEY